MANLTVVATAVALVEVTEKFTGPAAEAIDAGQYCRINTTNGKVELGNASSEAEARKGGLAVISAAAGMTVTMLRKGVIDLGDALDALDYDADVYLSATDGLLADASPGEDEVATATITGTPTGGTFTLTFGGDETAAIAYDAAASAVQSALEALDSIGPGNVSVSGSAGGPYTITFINDLADENVGAITSDPASLTGGTDEDVVIAVTNEGVQAKVVGQVIPGYGYPTPDKLLRVDL